MGQEIERKWLPKGDAYKKMMDKKYLSRIEQGYLCTDPVIRVRRDGDEYYLTYKGYGSLSREEHNLPLNRDAYETLIAKCDGVVIRKDRYRVPLKDGHLLEIDEFMDPFSPLVIFEVEFTNEEVAESFSPPDYFGRDVTQDARYTNAYLSSGGIDVNEILC